MAVSTSFAIGSHVWVEDPKIAWIDGEVVGVKGKEIEVKCTSDKKIVVKAANAYPKDPEFPPCGVEDMTRLAYLHEPGVLLNLNCRYDRDEIYTYTGNILIAVNPFKRIPRLYEKHIMEQYQGRALGELSPHPFAVADSAYRQLIEEKISQSILVSGESGAGKTESTKMLMQYLAHMGGKKSSSEGQSVEQQVLESNPVLEAFGNAKTVRNNNSSRFGKFVELQFDQRGKITGAAIRTYLLERSRVCQVSDPERNYHCFYMLCAAPSEDVKRYKLGNPRSFHYLNQSTFFELDGLDDAKEYLLTRKAMDVVGINSEEQDAIFRVVAAILHLGNVEFVKGESADSSKTKDDKSRLHLKNASELFMCDKKALEDSLRKRVIVTRDESITKSLDPQSATLSRDALAKIVYSRLFDWIVSRINESIGQDPNSKVLIGILDIYGFESFKTNSFEQFCINLTNEKLQQHFNQHVFKMEQEEYTKEEIDWSYVEFIDNKDILDLIEKKPGGVIALLDEACMFPRSTHETFAQKLYQTFKDNKRFSKPKLSQTDFTICHYAGDVTYQTDLFLDKNKDYVVAEHQALLCASKCSFVSNLFPRVAEESSKSSKFQSIGSRCKQQLQTLLETLNATEPHYIRCVKPNNVLKPSIFENFNVLQQLRCGGVLEAIRISCAGFPTRKTFSEFLSRFKILDPSVLDGRCDEITACKKILEKANLSGHQIGKTKVFLRAGQMADLDARRAEVLGLKATLIQRKTLSYFCRKYFTTLQQSAIQIQAFCRGQVARCRYECMRREAASIRIQKNFQMYVARKAYKNLYSSAICIQTGIRAVAARKELKFRRQTKAATLIQRLSRGYLAHLHYFRMKKAAITTQCARRRVIARKELRKLKMAAREASALQAAKIQLEKEVEDLTSSLEREKRLRADVEKAKTRELAELQSALQATQLQFEETKDLLIKEQEALKKQAGEHAELQSTLQTTQLQFEETKDLLVKEQEALKKEASERIELQSDLEATQLQLEETKNLLIKEQEALKKEASERAELQSGLQATQLQLEETKDLLIKEQEALKKEASERAELQSGLQATQLQLEETKDLLIKEQEGLNKEASEHAELQSALQVTQLQFEETKDLLNKEQEALQKEASERAELQSAFQEMQLQFEETKDLLIKEQEASKKKTQERAELQSTLQEMQLQFEETKDLLIKEQEVSKKEALEHEGLKSTFQEMQLQFEETKDLLIKEQEASKKEARERAELQSAFQEMQHQFEETKDLLIKEQEDSKKEAREHAEFQSAFHEMQQQFEETKDLLIKEQEASKKEAREHAELQSAFQEMQLQFEETKDLLLKEQEASKKEAEQAPIVHEVPVIDIEIMNKLTAENEELKERLLKAEHAPIVKEALVSDGEITNKTAARNEEVQTLVSSLEKKIDETSRISEERLKQALDAESKIIELKTAMQRLEEKISDMENEGQIMRQQALLYSPSTKTSDYGTVENGHNETGVTAKLTGSDSKKLGSDSNKWGGSDSKKLSSFGVGSKKFGSEKKNFTPEDVDILVNCVTKKLGFTEEKPAATITIYKCLIHWRAFELERTSVFDCLIQLIGSSIENPDDNDHLAYWLSNTSILLFLLQRSLSPPRRPPTPTSLFGRMTQSFRGSSSGLQVGAADFVRHVEAKYPALLFKQQLTAYVEIIFGIIRDNLKKELSPLLSSCIQAPEGSTATSPTVDKWHKLVDCLNGFLSVLKENYVPLVLTQKIFTQAFSYINVKLFNSLLLHKEWCTLKHGNYVKAGLAELEKWCDQLNEEDGGSPWDELKHIRQAVGFLVTEEKSSITYDDFTHDLCPTLSVHQLYRLCTLYNDDDKSNTKSVSPDAISNMMLLMTDDPEQRDDTNYLLDDHSSIPFPVDDVTKGFQKMDFTGVKPAAELAENPAFQFLQE